MLTCSAVALRRLVGRSSRTTAASPTIRSIVTSLTPTEIKAEDENDKLRNMLEDEKSDVQKYVESMRGEQVPGRKTVWSNLKPLPDPVLPDNPSEIAALDSVQSEMDSVMPDGRRRIVSIRQMEARVTQAPTDTEKRWIISFSDDGEGAETWNNPLMGWVSGADPMAPSITLQMDFDNAAAAVYFAKKRGWKYIVEEPIYRYGRSDDAQYQDNFLPQAIMSKIRMERKKCDHWYRPLSGASHYTRPLKFHGDGEVRQHGPNHMEKVADHVEGEYKLR